MLLVSFTRRSVTVFSNVPSRKVTEVLIRAAILSATIGPDTEPFSWMKLRLP